MTAHSNICMSVRCRWMATLDAENRYRILTPLERRVFLSAQALELAQEMLASPRPYVLVCRVDPDTPSV